MLAQLVPNPSPTHPCAGGGAGGEGPGLRRDDQAQGFDA